MNNIISQLNEKQCADVNIANKKESRHEPLFFTHFIQTI